MARALNMRVEYATRLALCAVAILVGVSPGRSSANTTPGGATLTPVFQGDAANPTRDKPQSKLWFAHGSWWAWLPTATGSAIWRRAASGVWQRQANLDAALSGLPGRADVWAEGHAVRAVLVAATRLAVVELQYDAAVGGYLPLAVPTQWQLEVPAPAQERSDNPEIETATIARDGGGRWWIAYPWLRRMWVRAFARFVGPGMDRTHCAERTGRRRRYLRRCSSAGRNRTALVRSTKRPDVLSPTSRWRGA